MANFGHLVAKFQVTEEGDSGTAAKKAKENQPPDGPSPSTGDDGGTVEPPGVDKEKCQRPAPPGRKPTRLVPPGVNMRKQNSADNPPPSSTQQRKGAGSNRQSSISFTTEDLDLFQRRPQFTEPPPPEDKTDLRRSRKGSRQGQDSSSDKRRSRSVGAPAFGGLRPMPPANKPIVPSKPTVADKPPDIRKKPSSLPRPFQAQQSADTSDEPTTERRPPSGTRNKSYKVATRAPGSRPTSGSRSRSGSQSKKSSEASKNVTSPANSLSPTSPISSDTRQVSRSRPSSGGSKPRPFSGSRSARTPVGNTQQSSQDGSSQLEQNTENDLLHVSGEVPPIKPSLGSRQNSDLDLKKKPKTQVGGSFIPVPKSYPKVPPKISPKPKSPGPSPLGSPRTIRALINHAPSTAGSDEDVKAAAKASILSALAKRSGIPLTREFTKPVEQPNAADKTAGQRLDIQEKQERVSVVVEGVTTSETSDSTGASFRGTKTDIEKQERVSVVVEGVTTTETSDSTGASFKGTNTFEEKPVKSAWSDEKERTDVSSLSLQENEKEGKTEVVQTGSQDKGQLVELKKQAEKDEVQNKSDLVQNGVQEESPKSHVKKDIVTSPDNSPALKKKKSFKKPSVPPPPPPSQQSNNSKLDIKSASSDATRNDTEELQKKSPLVPPKPSNAKLVKSGLNTKGQDIPVCKLVADKKGGEDNQGLVANQAVPSADQKLLPLQVFCAEQKGSPSDSNDADDEEDLTSGASPKSRVYIKSFSVEQKDLVSSSVGLNRGRPSSATPLESDSSSGEQKDKDKKGVLGKIRKLTFGLLPSTEELGERRQVGEATFYPEEEIPGTTKEGELHRTVGKTTFYSGENKTNGESNPSQDENVNSNEKPPVEKQRKVSLRQGTAGRKLSNKSFRSGIFVENDLYEGGNGLGAYENVFFGNIAQNLDTQPARGKLDSSSLESVEDKQNERPKSHDMESVGSADQVQPMKTPAETERGKVEEVTSTDDDRHSDPIYDNAVPLGNNNHLYTNVDFNSYNNRSVWRRKTIKRRQTTRKRDDENETEDGRQTEDFEDFSNSDDSFDSDTYSDSEEDKESIEPKYATIQGEAPPPEEPVSKAGKLQRIATELLTTERAYVKRLHLIDQIFHFKIVIENRSHHMFPDDVIPQMFSNVKSIYQFHNDFLLPQLEKRMADWENTPKIGDLMSKFAPFLKLYSEYVKNFDHGVNTLNAWQQRSQMFANIIVELQKKPECGMLSLQHHMLEPIQRVPRYEMLLKDYLKHLPEDSDDKADTEKALVLVTTAASHANETMWKIEKFRKLLELNEMFGGIVDLIDPSRELLKEGKIFKISARNGVLYDRYLFLFTDMLLLCTNHRMGLTATRSYHINNVLKLSGMQIMEGDNLETPFTFYVKTQCKTIELHCSTREEMLDWYTAIEDVITEFTKRQMSRLAGLKTTAADDKLGVCAPTWVKDQNTSMCMLCACGFSMIRRRHHCRCCGIVVCARCSSHKAPLAYQNNKPDRVCDNCYKTLSGRAENEGLGQNSNPRVKGVLQVKGNDPSVISGMMLMSSDKKIWERRWFALHENFVLYTFKAPQDVHAITSMPLPGYKVTETCKDDHIDKERVIKIHHAGTKKTYFFHVDNNTNYTKWLTGLQCAVKVELPPDYVPIEKRSQ